MQTSKIKFQFSTFYLARERRTVPILSMSFLSAIEKSSTEVILLIVSWEMTNPEGTFCSRVLSNIRPNSRKISVSDSCKFLWSARIKCSPKVLSYAESFFYYRFRSSVNIVFTKFVFAWVEIWSISGAWLKRNSFIKWTPHFGFI